MELDYRLIKEMWAFTGNRIAVRFAYEWHDDSDRRYRSYGNENWEFSGDGLMTSRFAGSRNSPPTRNGGKRIDPAAELKTDCALGEARPGQPCRQLDRSDTLIRHARPNLRPPPPIGSLTVPVKPSAILGPLIPTVRCAPLLAAGLFAAWLTAVPLPTVTTGAHGEYGPEVVGPDRL
jgi:hypothetical protein